MIEMNQLIVEMLEHVVGPTRVSSGHHPLDQPLYFLFNNPFN